MQIVEDKTFGLKNKSKSKVHLQGWRHLIVLAIPCMAWLEEVLPL